ncbi:MAG: CehA/McbA family metallohydrolase [Chloroflexi bacterium]|nr:CehA/McbA family metallohydrolase [Chloroflexota bacterium]
MHAYPGALHMHTHFSDGSGSVEDLAIAARDAGLRWIIITDHDDLRAKAWEGWLHDVLVIAGYEITPPRNHFLVLGIDRLVDHHLPPQAFIDEVYAAGGSGIIAHPDERVKNDFKEIYRWDDWGIDGPRNRDGRSVGLEVWNIMSDWGEHLTPRTKELLYFFPRLGISGPTPETLAWWDRLNMAGRRTYGVGGVDAHAFIRQAPWGRVAVFPYRWMFGTLTNYILLPDRLPADPRAATRTILDALAAGHSYFVNRLDGDCPALTFHAARGAERWHPGDDASLKGGPLTFVADTGRDAELHLIYNGRILARGIQILRHSVMYPGVYRLEGYRRGMPWLYTNPVYVRS